MKKYNEEEIKEVCKNSRSMRQAAKELGMSITTFTRIAKKLGCYAPNQGLKGSEKLYPQWNEISLEYILCGKHPNYNTTHLKKRLIREGYKENKCELCGIVKWNGKELTMRLDHIDGDSSNHKLENLRIICPNCDSQLDTYCGRNKNKKEDNKVSDEELKDALLHSENIREA